MAVNPSEASISTQIFLEGGGRLEGITEIADIRVENERIEWSRIAPDSVEVTGAINAYVYAVLPRTNEIKGQGLQIPFTRQITDETLRSDSLEIELKDLTSEHDFNPITGDFQHRVTAVIVINPKQVLSGNLQSRGETVLSQIAVGERPQRDDDVAGPAATRPPSPEEFESMRQDLEDENDSVNKLSPEDEKLLSVKVSDTEESTSESSTDNAQSPEEKDGGPLEWKPFPPPIS